MSSTIACKLRTRHELTKGGVIPIEHYYATVPYNIQLYCGANLICANLHELGDGEHDGALKVRTIVPCPSL